MALMLVPLYGLSCNGEALPAASDPECSLAMAMTGSLRTAMERAPAPELLIPPGPSQDYEDKPDFARSMNAGPGFRM